MEDFDISNKMIERLKEERKLRGYTLEEIGKFLGMTKSNYRKYEIGMIKRIPQDIIVKLANKYGISVAYLMGFDTPREKESESHRTIKNEIVNKLAFMSVDNLKKLNVFIDTFLK